MPSRIDKRKERCCQYSQKSWLCVQGEELIWVGR